MTVVSNAATRAFRTAIAMLLGGVLWVVAPPIVRASVVAKTGNAVGTTGPLRSRGGGRSPDCRRCSPASPFQDDEVGHVAAVPFGILGTTRGRSFARGASTPWNLVKG